MAEHTKHDEKPFQFLAKESSWKGSLTCDLAEKLQPAGLIKQPQVVFWGFLSSHNCLCKQKVWNGSKLYSSCVFVLVCLRAWSGGAITEQSSSASSVVKQRLCGRADDLADEQLGLQLLYALVCVFLCINLTRGWLLLAGLFFFTHSQSFAFLLLS